MSAVIDTSLQRRILIVTPDSEAARQIAGGLAELNPSFGDGEIASSTALDLAIARSFLHSGDVQPNIVIIDTDVAKSEDLLRFIADYRATQSEVIWVVYCNLMWWKNNESMLSNHEFGKRLKDYFHIEKTTAQPPSLQDLTDIVNRCTFDLVLQLFAKAAAALSNNDHSGFTASQLEKFADKAINCTLPLYRRNSPSSAAARTAFVSMRFTAAQNALYKGSIEPVLHEFGFAPVMIADTAIDGFVPERILAEISRCQLFVCDLSGLRPTVLIEVGAALMRRIPIVLIRDATVSDDELPFLLKTRNIVSYNSGYDLQDSLKREVRKFENSIHDR